jgi:fatty-acyl-CoA synthase
VLKPGSDLAGDRLRDDLARHLLQHGFAKWQLPDRYDFIAEIPRTSTGKFWKAKLRERYRA